MKKRILALILALCLMSVTLFTFASCGGDETPDDEPKDSNTQQGDDTSGSQDNTPTDTGLVDDEIPEDIAEDIF